MKRVLKTVETEKFLRLDLGCGQRKKEGFIGVDRRSFDGVDVVTDLMEVWPWKDGSVEEIYMSHVLEHFTGKERVHIFNEMYRVMVKGGKAIITTPYWCSNRAYGDFTHQWPPVSEMLYQYLNKSWRVENAPDTDIKWNPEGYDCDFESTGGYSMHPQIIPKSEEARNFAFTFYKEAAQDMICTLVKKE